MKINIEEIAEENVSEKLEITLSEAVELPPKIINFNNLEYLLSDKSKELLAKASMNLSSYDK